MYITDNIFKSVVIDTPAPLKSIYILGAETKNHFRWGVFFYQVWCFENCNYLQESTNTGEKAPLFQTPASIPAYTYLCLSY